MSAIWKLSKDKRIIVNLSGIYFQAILNIIVAIIALLLKSDTLFVISIINFIFSFRNLNPFVRYDGYWILSDIMSCPNLMEDANSLFYSFYEKIINKNRIPNYTNREIFVLLFFILSKSTGNFG